MRKWLPWLRRVVGIVIVVLVGREVVSVWGSLTHASITLAVRPLPLAAAIVLTWISYAALIAIWRAMLLSWGTAGPRPVLPPLTAARIWILSNLGRYLPGKIWTITGMALLAQREGIAAWTATGSAVLLQVLSLASGAALVALGGFLGMRVDVIPFGWTGVVVVLTAAVAGIAVVASPYGVTWLLRRWTKGSPVGAPPMRILLAAVAVFLVTWVLYGLALWLMARGILAEVHLGVGEAIGAWAAAYLIGFLVPFAPGGIGVREGVLVALLQGTLGVGGAAVLAATTRLVVTVAEFGAAAPLYFFRPRPVSVGNA